ncbi:hypothetical protein BD769DRAFT_1669468 [Suillus cothurnatus]|nr:hypothetical protein BD769DRAFT_1669468 [Suillus cothurnatus]
MHTYPPASQPTTSAIIHTYPPKPTQTHEDFRMSMREEEEEEEEEGVRLSLRMREEEEEEEHDSPLVRCRMKEEDDQRPTKVVLKEIDQSSKLRDDVRELRYSHHELLVRKRNMQTNAHYRKLEMQSIADQYCDKNGHLELEKVEALTSLEQQHHSEVSLIQNRMALNIEEVQHATRAERDLLLAEKDALHQCETLLARQKLIQNERELARLTAGYDSKIASLDNQIQQAKTIMPALPPSWRHVVGKKPVATCTNIVGFLPIPDALSESPVDEPIISDNSSKDGLRLTSLLNLPIKDAMVGMLAEALAKALQCQQTSPKNKANVRDLFKETFHLMKDDEYMLYEGAAHEAVSLFIGSIGPGPDPLALQWDIVKDRGMLGAYNLSEGCI